MFESVKETWQIARAENLRREFDDAFRRLRALPEEVNLRTADTLAIAHKSVIDQFGPLANISNRGKKQIHKHFLKMSKQSFDLDMGKAYGYALLSLHIEAMRLPGDDAKYVLDNTQDLLEAALTVSMQLDRKIDGTASKGEPKAEQADEVARRAITVGKSLGAKTAREAAEMTAGRKLTDEEWSKYGEGWERNWD